MPWIPSSGATVYETVVSLGRRLEARRIEERRRRELLGMKAWYPGSRGRPPIGSNYKPDPHRLRLTRREADRRKHGSQPWTPGSRGRPPLGSNYVPDPAQKKAANKRSKLKTLLCRKHSGMCVACGMPRGKSKIYCDFHRAKESARLVKKFRARVAAGLCMQCSKSRSRYAYRCDECQAKENIRWKLKYGSKTKTPA